MVAPAPGVALLHRFSSIVDIKAGIALNKTFVKLISWYRRRISSELLWTKNALLDSRLGRQWTGLGWVENWVVFALCRELVGGMVEGMGMRGYV